MNLPNQLTLSRFVITVVFVAVLASEWRWAHTTGLLLFAVGSITDYLDGEIARRRNLMTDFGKLMDPLADKVMMAAAFICLIPLDAFPAWVAIIIISREFLITGLRLLAANKGVVLPAERMGKHKTIWQIVTILFFLLLLAIAEVGDGGFYTVGRWWAETWKWGGGLLIAWATVLTLYSGLGYLWKNRRLIETA
jgi:CDP-diacylglycerol--glycerol-3-phosphate 3-phosphatidyltransferase